MKKYRLKKDTFLAKKGELFKEVNESGAVYLQRIKQDGSDLFTKIAKAPIIDFDEWFEEVKEFEGWKLKDGEEYLALVNGYIRTYYARSVLDEICNLHVTTGNCYPLDTSDEVIIKEQKLIPQAMHRLKMAAKKAWFEFDGSEGPDWSDGGQNKWSIQYEHARGVLIIVATGLTQNLGRVYFPTRESCRAYINNNKDDLELLFGVE